MGTVSRAKTVLCLCHDVTTQDIDIAVAAGYRHPETIKRFTAAFMGPCQGKACADLVMSAIADRLEFDVASLRRPTTRPPAAEVRLGQLVDDPAGAPE